MKSTTILTFTMFLLFSSTLSSQAEFSTDEIAIRQIVQDIQDGWNAKSGEQYAAHFADDHDFVVWTGYYIPNSDQDGNAKSHQGIFTTFYKTTDIELRIEKIRFVTPEIALIHTLGGRYETGEAVPEFPEMIQTMLLKKTSGEWQIISFHNLDILYDILLRQSEPEEAAKVAYAKEHYKGWYGK